MGLSLTAESELNELTRAFDTFNLVSSQLEASYSSLEQRMGELRAQLADERAERIAASADKAALQLRLAGILDALPGGVIVLDAAGIVTDLNERAGGWFPLLSAGTVWSKFCEANFHREVSDHGDLILRSGRHFVVARETGPQQEQILLLTDVTDQRQVDEVVQRHRRLAGLGEMLATLAHQLRTPITAALLYASSARRTIADEARCDGLLDKSIACLRDLEKLVADMLSFARGNSHCGEQTVNIGELLEEIDRSVRPLCQPTQQLQLDDASQGAAVRGNPRVLASAVVNLIVNALENAGNRARVSVRSRIVQTQPDASQSETQQSDAPRQKFARSSVNGDCEHEVVIEIHDNGPGVPEDLAQRIFEPFFTTRSGGTGLGLAAARSIARAHRGDLQLLQSVAGARFELRLPVLDAGADGHDKTGDQH